MQKQKQKTMVNLFCFRGIGSVHQWPSPWQGLSVRDSVYFVVATLSLEMLSSV
jgi:hypothetical protein